MLTQFRSVVASLLAVTLAMPAFGAPVPKRRPPQAGQAQPAPAAAPSCEGLTSAAGNFKGNQDSRSKLNKNFCETDNFAKSIDEVRKQLEACKEISKYVEGDTHPVNVDVFFPDMRKRAVEACEIHKHYTRVAGDLCTAYGTEGANIVKAVEAAKAQVQSDGPGETLRGQVLYYNKIAETTHKAAEKYRHFESGMKGANNNLNKQTPGLAESLPSKDKAKERVVRDKVFHEAATRVRYQIQKLTENLRKQAGTQGVDARAAVAGAAGDNSRLRIKKGMVGPFWTALVKCESLAKDADSRQRDKGLVDRIDSLHQSTLALSLGVAKVETKDLAEKFGKIAKEYEENSAAAQSSAQRMARTDSSVPAVKNASTITGEPARGPAAGMGPATPQSIAKGEGLLKSYKGNETEAAKWLTNRNFVEQVDAERKPLIMQNNGKCYRVFHAAAINSYGAREWYLPTTCP